MSIEIRVPDIGDFDAVEVIEVLIKVGDAVEQEQSVLVLESDKASMEVPASSAGVVERLNVKVGDKVKKGDVIATLSADQAQTSASKVESKAAEVVQSAPENQAAQTQNLIVPDIGDFNSVSVIEVNVSVGQQIAKDDTVITLESDKASMEVPAEYAGELLSLNVKVGDKVSKGAVIGTVKVAGAKVAEAPIASVAKAETSSPSAVQSAPATAPAPQAPVPTAPTSVAKN